MTDFADEFNRDTGYNRMCHYPYPNTVWGGPWPSADSSNSNASQFYWGVQSGTAFVAIDADPLDGCGSLGVPRTDMYYGNDDGTVYPITSWSDGAIPKFTVRFKMTDTGVAPIFNALDPITGQYGWFDNSYLLGTAGLGRYLSIDVFHQIGGGSLLTIGGENDRGSVVLPDPTLDAWYTLEALWDSGGIAIRLWLDESESRPSVPTLLVGPASGPPAVVYDETFGPEFQWLFQALPGVVSGDERGRMALDYVRIVDAGGGGGGGGSIGDGGGDSHPTDGSDGTGTDQNPNGFLSHMWFFEGFA